MNSPDDKIVENVWGVMARMVYARGKHYQNVEDLKVAIEKAWLTVGSAFLMFLREFSASQSCLYGCVMRRK